MHSDSGVGFLWRRRFDPLPDCRKRSMEKSVDAILDDAVDPLVGEIPINVSLDGEVQDAPLQSPDELEIAFAEFPVGQSEEASLTSNCVADLEDYPCLQKLEIILINLASK